MRILTVRQPWAWAIIHGGKNVENRPRNIAGGYRGPVAIHAGLQVDIEALTMPNIVSSVALKRLFVGAGHPSTFRQSPVGAIIGVVDLVDALAPHFEVESPWALADSWHLMFANPRPLVEPIPYTGALGLRNLAARDPETVLAITRQIGPTS